MRLARNTLKWNDHFHIHHAKPQDVMRWFGIRVEQTWQSLYFLSESYYILFQYLYRIISDWSEVQLIFLFSFFRAFVYYSLSISVTLVSWGKCREVIPCVLEHSSNSVLQCVLAVFIHPSLCKRWSGELWECHVQAEILERESGFSTIYMLF